MKKVYTTVLVLLVCIFALGGILTAADWYREDRTTNIISVGELSAEINDIYEQDTVAMPGDNISKIVSVRNNGTSDEYVRVRLSGVWTDSGEVAQEGELSYEINKDDWIADEETGYYYYTKILKPGETSEPLMYSFTLDGPGVNNYYSFRPGSITVAMEAVQAAAGGLSLWEGGPIQEDNAPLRQAGENAGLLRSDRGSYYLYGDGEIPVDFRGADDGFLFGTADLFKAFKNILPGQTVIQNISVGNSSGSAVRIYLKAACRDEGSGELVVRLLENYTLLTVKSGGTTVYSGPVWDVRDNINADELYGSGICLGEFNVDEQKSITAELKLSAEVDNEFEGLAGEVDWIFYARGSEREDIPQTGDNNMNIYLMIMLVSGGACVAIILTKMIVKRISAVRGGGGSSRFVRRSSGNVGGRDRSRGYRSIPFLIVAGVSAAALGTGITMAFMTDTSAVQNTVEPGALKLELEETAFDPDTVLSPDLTVPKDPFVKNTGNVPMLTFIRVNIPVKSVSTVDPETKKIVPEAEHELFSFEAGNDWILMDSYISTTEQGEKEAVYVYGYIAAVLEPGEATTALFNEIRFLNVLEGELEYASLLDVKVCGYGVQSEHIAADSEMAARLGYAYENFVKEAE